MKRESTATLSALYQRWRKPILRLLQGRLGSRAEAEDTVQQVFVRLIASGRLPEAGKEQAYLSRAAGNLVIDGWRRSGRYQSIELLSMDASSEVAAGGEEHDPVRHAQHRQRLARLDQALTELPERQREAFILNVLDGCTQEEVAARMGISKRMVSKHVSRAYAYCELRLQYGSVAQMQRLLASARREEADETHREPERGSPR
ncbi:RNA polymerase sigma factor [Piscinibacter sp.]|uniref:RNA polymerase sigma factor n=1 Tax=Piscinibacter sp. TaxID=1903157 RepID=UPI0039E6CCED